MTAALEDARRRLIPAVEAAARLALRVGDALDGDRARLVADKGGEDPVTVGDWGGQALIGRALAELFPGEPVVGEEDLSMLGRPEHAAALEAVTREVRVEHPEARLEDVAAWIGHGGSREASPVYWTIDPIDGTRGFVRGDQFAVLLARVEDGRPSLAFMACPRLGGGLLLTAVRGAGAFVGERRLRVSATTAPADARYAESIEAWSSAETHAAIAAAAGLSLPPLKMDSAAKYASLARAEVDVVLRRQKDPSYREKIWDHAAGVLVIEEAGGRVSDFAGRSLDFSRVPYLELAGGLVATNGRLHEAMLTAIEGLGLAASAT
jgi:3'(2'), 5'-bisphosphate nucleotidase